MKIKFIAGTKDITNSVNFPEPSKRFIPDWYKNIPGKKNIINVKKCVPFLDAMTYGYVQTTWTDIHINKNNEDIDIFFDHNVKILNYREKSDMPIKDEFYDIEFIWQRPWSIVLPKGYSGLITHPLNRIDLPFYTLSGIIDFDKSIHTTIGNIPFYIKRGFTGTIPTGTPMFQIIPIKRDTWMSEKEDYDKKFWELKNNEKSKINDFYKKKIWQKKIFD